jgi:thymidine kinase
MDSSDEGYLELAIGPMFSGKTTHLIQAYKKYTYIGKRVIVLNYSEDKRYHETMLSTHDKMMIPCVQTTRIRDIWNSREFVDSQVVLINEGQFFPDLYDTVLEMIDTYNKTVYICGLDGDFKRGKFGEILELIPHCDKVTKLQSLCSQCKNGKVAIFSHRLTEEDSQILIGSDIYVPLCRKCYLKANAVEYPSMSLSPC